MRREPRERFKEYFIERPDLRCPVCGKVSITEWRIPDKYNVSNGDDCMSLECDICGSFSRSTRHREEYEKIYKSKDWGEGHLIKKAVENTLKPCPCCGKRVKFETEQVEKCVWETYIKCMRCELYMETWGDRYRYARDRWNRRVSNGA